MRKLITLLLIGAVVVSGSAFATAHWGGTDRERVTEKLDELVDEEVITSEEADLAERLFDALYSLVEDEIEERRTEQEKLNRFLEDDLLTAAELAQLPEDHPLRDTDGPFSKYLQDGQITEAELDEIRDRWWYWGGWGRWGHWGRIWPHLGPRPHSLIDMDQIWDFLEDDVITASELAQLPDDHPFRDTDGPFSEYLQDGQITDAELDEILDHWWPGGSWGFRRPWGRSWWSWGDWEHREHQHHRSQHGGSFWDRWFFGHDSHDGNDEDEPENGATNTNTQIVIPNRNVA